jgi:hypothetical protein
LSVTKLTKVFTAETKRNAEFRREYKTRRFSAESLRLCGEKIHPATLINLRIPSETRELCFFGLILIAAFANLRAGEVD